MPELDVATEPGTTRLLHLEPLHAEAFLPFGAVISAPATIGDRSVYTQWLGSERPEMTPRLHANHVGLSTLPIIIDRLEQHPHSAQMFLPLDVERYVIVVAPVKHDGTPDAARAQAFLAPGNLGVIYGVGVWHAGATVLDRPGNFGVLMWRNDSAEDDVFFGLASSLQVQL